MKKELQGLYDPTNEHDACGVGFICNINGTKSHEVLNKGINTLVNMSHRGSAGADKETGDGAGIQIQLPHRFLKKIAKIEDFELPEVGHYATGLVFLPYDKEGSKGCMNLFDKTAVDNGLKVLSWRKVPIDETIPGITALKSIPLIYQVFVTYDEKVTVDEFRKKIYKARRKAYNEIKESNIKDKEHFYVCSLSNNKIVYKGMLMPKQLKPFYVDLYDETIETSVCILHSRFSTNTLPSWDLAHPYRYVAHNGEINTIRGNREWFNAKEAVMLKENKTLEGYHPFLRKTDSDTASLDAVFEFLTRYGKSKIHSLNMMHAIKMLMPPAWENNLAMDEKVKDFYKFKANLVEPWDGPATIVFSDGDAVGASLDRNGFRPARYILTDDNMLIFASEIGVLDIKPDDIVRAGRLAPGETLLVDLNLGHIYYNDEIEKILASENDYGSWLKDNQVPISLDIPKENSVADIDDITKKLAGFGYNREDLNIVIKHMINSGEEITFSTGDDTPLAVLSKRNRNLFDYFKQMFAQVTNPPIDPIRESISMSAHVLLGKSRDFLTATPEHAKKMHLDSPLLTEESFQKIKELDNFKYKILSTIYDYNEDEATNFQNARKAIDNLCKEAQKAVKDGCELVILSDREVSKEHPAIPSLIAVASIHQNLKRNNLRTKTGIIVETCEPREPHHFNMLCAYGAEAIVPYGAYLSIQLLFLQKRIKVTYEEAISNYLKASQKGMLKILSKMGISTIRSYIGSEMFEAIGLSNELIREFFSNTPSNIEGISLEEVIYENLSIHKAAYFSEEKIEIKDEGNLYQRATGEVHVWTNQTVKMLKDACKEDSYEKYKEVIEIINSNNIYLRHLLKFKSSQPPIDISEVESARSIAKRFVGAAMSFGALSYSSHANIAIALNRLNAVSNSGEGGENPKRYTPLPNGDSELSRTKQIASGRFGVDARYLNSARELQIKATQGAKPGEGGQLPGNKVTKEVALSRNSTPGVTLISPPPHHDIYSIEDLGQIIYDLKNINPKARISVKLTSTHGVGTIAAGVAKGYAEAILLSSGDGGTGASALSSIKHAGAPWELGIADLHQTLTMNGLRDNVRIQTDGHLISGRDIAIAAMLGAQEYGFGTSLTIAVGCIQCRGCNKNTCPVGICTQDPKFLEKYHGSPDYVVSFLLFVAENLREILASLGFKTLEQLVGRVDLLEIDESRLDRKTKGINFDKMLYSPEIKIKKEELSPDSAMFDRQLRKESLKGILDNRLVTMGERFLEGKTDTFKIDHVKIKNVDRSTGAMLTHTLMEKFEYGSLKEDSFVVKFNGVAGQSFGAFLRDGISFYLDGFTNDYVGKGLSGGKIVVKCKDLLDKKPILVGNTCFYGAITGKAFIAGGAGERFCVRNSGIDVVVERVGDHGCEYMTGGTVLILGSTGKNFGAGMSGGIAYIYDETNTFESRFNSQIAKVKTPDQNDLDTIYKMIEEHYNETESLKARFLLNSFNVSSKHFKKVISPEYEAVLEKLNS